MTEPRLNGERNVEILLFDRNVARVPEKSPVRQLQLSRYRSPQCRLYPILTPRASARSDFDTRISPVGGPSFDFGGSPADDRPSLIAGAGQ